MPDHPSSTFITRAEFERQLQDNFFTLVEDVVYSEDGRVQVGVAVVRGNVFVVEWQDADNRGDWVCTQSFVVRWDWIPRLTTLLSTLGYRSDDYAPSGNPS